MSLDYLEVRSVWQVVASFKVGDTGVVFTHSLKKKKVCEMYVMPGFMLGSGDTALNQI